MIRAIFFDFYSVWTPDKISYYLATAEQIGPSVHKDLTDLVEQYYHGKVDITVVADSFKTRLGHDDISMSQFRLEEQDISPQIVKFMQNLHGHFFKIGILANLGKQEIDLLNNFNEHNQVFEVIASPMSFQVDQPLLSQEVFIKSLQAIGEPVTSTLYVSGNLYNIEFAASQGINVLQFEGLSKLQQYIDNLIANGTND